MLSEEIVDPRRSEPLLVLLRWPTAVDYEYIVGFARPHPRIFLLSTIGPCGYA
jgi:hypothetical protein